MAVRLSTRQVTWALVILWLAALAVTVGMLVEDRHAMSPVHLAPALILTVILLVWPFALGWRPFTPTHHRLRTCPACGTLWRPADEGGTKCPACGA